MKDLRRTRRLRSPARWPVCDFASADTLPVNSPVRILQQQLQVSSSAPPTGWFIGRPEDSRANRNGIGHLLIMKQKWCAGENPSIACCDERESPDGTALIPKEPQAFAGAVLLRRGVIARSQQLAINFLYFGEWNVRRARRIVAPLAGDFRQQRAREDNGQASRANAESFHAIAYAVRRPSGVASIPSRRILESSVVRASPSRAAAPFLPPTTHFVSSRV